MPSLPCPPRGAATAFGYKLHEPNAFSKVPGWGAAAQGLAWVTTTHDFFKSCRERAGAPCQVKQ